MLELQKQYNTLISDKQSPITKKYLPLPYDINEIIRNKIKEDSKKKAVEDYIKFTAEVYKKDLVSDFLDYIQAIFKRRIKWNSNNAIGEYDDSIQEILQIFENKCNLDYCINEEEVFGLNTLSPFIYNTENRQLVIDLYNKVIKAEVLLPIRFILTNINNVNSNDNNYKIKTINGCNVLTKANHFNTKGFNKLCKQILAVFDTYTNVLEHITPETVSDFWIIENFYIGFSCYELMKERKELMKKTELLFKNDKYVGIN